MLSGRWRLTEPKVDGSTKMLGVDCGKLTVAWRGRRHLVLRAAGRACWSGVGSPREYAPTIYSLCVIHGEIQEPTHYPYPSDSQLEIESVRNEEPARFWRRCLNKMIAEGEALDDAAGGAS